MAEVVLFHHALGLTPGVLALAEELRSAGHTAHTPDLYEGRMFGTAAEGVAHAQEIGFGEVIARGVRAVEALPAGLVYAGISLVVLPAQKLAQSRPGARGALLLEARVPASEFGAAWPDEVPPGRPAPVHRQLAAVVRPGRGRAADPAGADLPRRHLGQPRPEGEPTGRLAATPRARQTYGEAKQPIVSAEASG